MGLIPKMIILLIFIGHIQQVRSYICEVGRERDVYKKWRYVLAYAYPCGCTRVIMGGMNTKTPKRPFEPKYVDKPLLSDNVKEIRAHYGLECYRKAPTFDYCPADQTTATDSGKSTAMVIWQPPEAYDVFGNHSAITCNPSSGSLYQLGETDVHCEARDVNENTAMCSFTVAVKDREVPTFNFCPSNRNIEQTIPESTAVAVWKNPAATDNSGHAPTVTCNVEPGTHLAFGQTQVVCEAVDTSGNKGTCELTVTVVEAKVPSFSLCPKNQLNTTAHGQPTSVMQWIHPQAVDNSGDPPTVTCNHESGSNFRIGQTDVLCTAVDASGNEATCTFVVDIEDRESPSFNLCPSYRKVERTLPESTAVMVWENPIANDNSGHAPTVTCNIDPGARLAVGQTQVVCEAVDTSGNKETCEFTVDVIEAEAPSFISSCPGDQMGTTAHGQSTSVKQWERPEAVDNSGDPPTVTCDHESGSNFRIGQTDVVCKAVDASGNTETCTFIVVIEDVEAPSFTFCPGNITTTSAHDQSTGVEWIRPEAVDNSEESPSITCNLESGSTFVFGRTDVFCTASDGRDNKATCRFTVDVLACDAGWVPFGRLCYYKGEADTMTWQKASGECHGRGGYLATVNTEDKQIFLASLLIRNSWIGLNSRAIWNSWVWDAGDDPGFTWSGGRVRDNGRASPVSAYQAWHESQPSSDKKCVIMKESQNRDWKWNDRNCSKAYGYVCQKEEINLRVYPTNQSSTDRGLSEYATDGNTNGVWRDMNNSCTHTTSSDTNPWWRVDQGTPTCVGQVVLYNRINYEARLLGATVRIGNNDSVLNNPACPSVVSAKQIDAGQEIIIPCNLAGRYISVNLADDNTDLTLCEVKAYRGICATECDDGWDAFGYKCYFRGNDSMTWQDARNDCHGRGGHLATVNTAAKQAFLANLLVGDSWIGLNRNSYATSSGFMTYSSWVWDAGDDPGFTWSGGAVENGGTSSPASAYHAWYEPQPSGIVLERCVIMQSKQNWKWNDWRCDATHSYVCQKDMYI